MFKDKKTQADGNICLTAEKNNTEMILRAIEAMRTRVKTEAPLIHCITNPISIHDCANVVLAAGGRPMMAEHPAEVAEITVTAGALALNLGNITDARRESGNPGYGRYRMQRLPKGCRYEIFGTENSGKTAHFKGKYVGVKGAGR